MRFTALSDRHTDLLGEVSNIGVGHAATALSRMIGWEVGMRVPRVAITPLGEVADVVGGPEHVVAAVYCQFMGEIAGHILLLFPRRSVDRLIERLLGGPAPSEREWNERSTSSIREIGNILASTYLNTLGAMLRMTLIPTVPAIAYDMAGAIVDGLLIEQGIASDLALLIDTEFFEKGDRINGHFFLVPDPESVSLVISRLGADPG
jgi:chemotaxis protein CheC